MSKKKKQDENKKNGDIIEILDSALDEDISEISEISHVDEAEALPEKKSGSSVGHFLLGLLVIFLAVIGAMSSFNYISERINSVIDNTEQKNEFARFIYPVVICDPPNFDETVSLKNETIISSAVWDIILFEDKSKYTVEFDYIIVPEVDVEKHAAKLFGSGLTVKHTSLSASDVTFYYDKELNSYRIPKRPNSFTYSPVIEEISKSGDTYILSVGYISPTPDWMSFTSTEAEKPEKYVDYVVKKTSSGYTLTAIRASAKQTSAGVDAGL